MTPDETGRLATESVDPLDALEEKWNTESAGPTEWERRARWALGLARKWKRNALEWEESARAD